MRRLFLVFVISLFPIWLYAWSWDSTESDVPAEGLRGEESTLITWNLADLELGVSSSVYFTDADGNNLGNNNSISLIQTADNGNFMGRLTFSVHWKIISFDPVSVYLGLSGPLRGSNSGDSLNWECSWMADEISHSVGGTDSTTDYATRARVGRHLPSSMGVISEDSSSIEIITEDFSDNAQDSYSGFLYVYIDGE